MTCVSPASRVTDYKTDFGIHKLSKFKIQSNTRNIEFTFFRKLAAIADLID